MSLSMQDVKKSLQDAGFLSGDWMEDENRSFDSPWFVKIMTGLGAWLATICFLAVYVLVSLDDINALREGIVMLTSGCIFIVLMYLIHPIHEFSKHLRVSFSLVGQCLMFVGIYDLVGNIYAVLAIIILMESLLLLAYRENTLRFVSCWVIIAALVYLFEINGWIGGIHFIVTVMAGLLVYISNTEYQWVASNIGRLYNVLTYALSTALFILMLATVPSLFLEFELNMMIANWWISGIGLALVFLSFILSLVKQWQLPMNSRIIVILIGISSVIAVIGVFMPAVLAGILVLCLGFNHGNQFLQAMAIVYIIGIFPAYYIQMDISLLAKSLILMLAGVLALVMQLILTRYVDLADADNPE